MRDTQQKAPRISPRILNQLAAASVSFASMPSAHAPITAMPPAFGHLDLTGPNAALVRKGAPSSRMPDWINEVTSGREETNFAEATLPPLGAYAILGSNTFAEEKSRQISSPSSQDWGRLSLPSAVDLGRERQRYAVFRLKELEHEGLVSPGLVRLVEGLILRGPHPLFSRLSGERSQWNPSSPEMPPWLTRPLSADGVLKLVEMTEKFRISEVGSRFEKATIQGLVAIGFLAGGEQREGGVEGVGAFLSGMEKSKVQTFSDLKQYYLSTAAIGIAKISEFGGFDVSNLIPPSERARLLGPSGGWLNKLATGDVVAADPGYCVTAVLETMEKNWVPNPEATGKDAFNNPRGLASQLINQFGWRSLELEGFGKHQRIKSAAYGDFDAVVMSAFEYTRAVEQGKIPSGAVVFQTRHPSWNGNSKDSLGFDASRSANRGKNHWNGSWSGTSIYGDATRWVFVLVPGELDGVG